MLFTLGARTTRRQVTSGTTDRIKIKKLPRETNVVLKNDAKRETRISISRGNLETTSKKTAIVDPPSTGIKLFRLYQRKRTELEGI